MDYLDPNKQRQHTIMLFVGYILIGIAIIMATWVLFNQAKGYGLDRNGTLIQTGLTFFSSQPNPATINVNGVQKGKTNTRMFLVAGLYDIQLKRDGYRTWQRKINLQGGGVLHFDYPLLFANTLTPSKKTSYSTAPSYATQSPDRRWNVVGKSSLDTYDVYDLKNPTKPPLSLTIPPGVMTKAVGAETLEVVEWADDNQHILLKHIYDGKSEFIVTDRTLGDAAKNLNTTLLINPGKLVLRDKKYDQYYIYDESTLRLQKISLKSTTPEFVLDQVIGFQPYGSDTILYTTTTDAPAGKVLVKLLKGDKKYGIRSLSAGGNYLLNLASYSGAMYVATGATNENKLYIYKDPIGQLGALPNHALVPAQVLRVNAPNELDFSTNAQFISIQNGQEFAVYDIENKVGYHYTTQYPLDSPQKHAQWMDGHRIVYVSGGKLLVFDYDYANVQTLIPADSRYEPAFTPDYKLVFGLANNAGSEQVDMWQTSLLAPKDQ